VRCVAGDSDGVDIDAAMKKVSAAAAAAADSRGGVMLRAESDDALPMWLQHQLDRSIAKHLEKGLRICCYDPLMPSVL